MIIPRASTPISSKRVGPVQGIALTAVVVLITSLATTCSAQSLEEISATLSAQDESIKSISVRYRYSSVARGTSEEITNYLKTAYLINEVHTYAMSGDKRYFRFEQSDNSIEVAAAVSAASEAAPEKPSRTLQSPDRTYAYNGNRLIGINPGGEAYTIWNLSDSKSDSQFFSSIYLTLSGRVAPDIVERKDQSPKKVGLREAISLGQCQVRKEKEEVHGTKCVVLDWSGTVQRTIWLDPALNFAIRKQVLYYPNTPLEMWNTVVADFIKVDTAVPLWLPKRASSQSYPGPEAPARLHNRGLVEFFYEVTSLQVNNVPDELFELKIPTGAKVYDFTRPRKVSDIDKPVATTAVQGADGRLIDLPLIAPPK